MSFTVLIMCLSQTLAAIVATLCSLTAYPNDPILLERFDSIEDDSEVGELIHVF